MFQNKFKKDFIFKLFTLQFKFILKPKQIIFNNSKAEHKQNSSILN